MSFTVGDNVKWNWGDGTGTGRIAERYTEEITLSIKGTDVTRNATEDDPAYLVVQEDGDKVLKSASELDPA